jgi:hypothetical protein
VIAERQLLAALAARTPHLKAKDQKDYLRQLQRTAYPDRQRAPQPMPKIAHDPDAARAWFEAQGVRTAGGSHA